MLMDFVTSHAGWAWLIAGLILFALELVMPGVFLLWIGFAAAIVGVLLLNLPGIGIDFPLAWQLAAFAMTAIVSALLARLVFHYGENRNGRDFNASGRDQVGRTVTVEDPILAGRGRVRLGDSLWAAEGPDAPAGAILRVRAVKGIVLVVEQ